MAVPNGSKGLELAFADPPDLMLLDLNLPGQFDGFQVCEKIRANPLTRSVPILIISATSDEDAKQRALAAGATAYYTKPFSPMALLKEIEAIRVKQKSVPPPTE
jgi:DNA-binding response OmpR family regulator